jgi:hypothetical protein
MKKRFYWMVALILAGLGLVLAGCSGQQSAASNADNPAGGDDRQFTMPLSMQLAVGTLKLEGTEAAVTPEQAAELLPLWKAARSLSSADNVTTQEREAVFNQIQKAMTDEQMQAIQALDVSGQNMGEVMQELGIALPAGGPDNRNDEGQSALRSALEGGQGPGGGGPPAGGGPPPGGGGEGMPPDGGPDGSAGNNNQAGGRAPGGFDTAFYQAVINLLEEKVE